MGKHPCVVFHSMYVYLYVPMYVLLMVFIISLFSVYYVAAVESFHSLSEKEDVLNNVDSYTFIPGCVVTCTCILECWSLYWARNRTIQQWLWKWWSKCSFMAV